VHAELIKEGVLVRDVSYLPNLENCPQGKRRLPGGKRPIPTSHAKGDEEIMLRVATWNVNSIRSRKSWFYVVGEGSCGGLVFSRAKNRDPQLSFS
jgi:hypothetical protein